MSAVAERRIEPSAPVRVLFVASRSLGYAASLLAWVRAELRPVDTLVVRDAPAGPELSAARIAAQLGATVVHCADPVAEVAAADVLVAGVRDLDDVPARTVLAAGADAWCPTVLAVEGGYPMPTDEPSRRGQHAARVREAAKDRQAAVEARSNARAEARSVAGRAGPRGRGGRTLEEARRAHWDARQDGQAG